MHTLDETPIYNLKAVVQETGLKPDTLRAWERRYGLPEPDRTMGGHRLYSQRDIEVLKWLIARQDEGMSISRAVDLWNTLRVEGRDPLQMPEYNQVASTPSRQTLLSVGDSVNDLRQAWIDACLSFDVQRAEGLLGQAFALYPAEVACFEVLQRGMHDIGEGWYHGEFTVQQEHFASALAMRRLEALIAAAPPPTRPGRLLIGCPSGEDHAFSPLLLSLLLRRHGYDVIYLGANIPVDQLEHTIATARPDLVVMAAQQLHTAASLISVGVLLQRVRVPFGFGGRVFNEIAGLEDRITGHFLGHSLEQAASLIETLMTTRQPAHHAAPLPQEDQSLLANFRENRHAIENSLWKSLARSGITPANMNIANLNFGRNIEAALALGDMNCLHPDLLWVRGLLKHYNLPEALLMMYLHEYRAAVQTTLQEAGAPITSWLESLDHSVLSS